MASITGNKLVVDPRIRENIVAHRDIAASTEACYKLTNTMILQRFGKGFYYPALRRIRVAGPVAEEMPVAVAIRSN